AENLGGWHSEDGKILRISALAGRLFRRRFLHHFLYNALDSAFHGVLNRFVHLFKVKVHAAVLREGLLHLALQHGRDGWQFLRYAAGYTLRDLPGDLRRLCTMLLVSGGSLTRVGRLVPIRPEGAHHGLDDSCVANNDPDFPAAVELELTKTLTSQKHLV